MPKSLPSRAREISIGNYEALLGTKADKKLFLDPIDRDYCFCLTDVSIRIPSDRVFEEDYSEGDQRLRKEARGIWGFTDRSRNRIYVKRDSLAMMVLSIGHEIGHMITHSLGGLEEKKAYAFEGWWTDSLLGLGLPYLSKEEIDSIRNKRPSGSKIHEEAFDLVKTWRESGYSCKRLFYKIIAGDLPLS